MNLTKPYLVILLVVLLFQPLGFLVVGEQTFLTDDISKETMDKQQTIYNLASPKPPAIPTGKKWVKIECNYTFETSNVNPNGLPIAYYFDWGDGTNTGWFGPLASGKTCMAVHRWSESGVYEVKAKSCFIYRDPAWKIYRYGEHSNFSEPFEINARRYPVFDQIFFFITDLFKKPDSV
jgi:hypothetical protein